MDDFDSQSFLQLAPTIPDGAGLGRTLPSTSLAPDQGQGLRSAPATSHDTPPQDLAAAAANAFRPGPFSLATPKQATPPAIQPSAPAGPVQPLTNASSLDSQSLIQALRQVPDGAGSDWAGLSNNTSPDQGLGSTSDGLTASAATPPEDFDTANAFPPQPLFPGAHDSPTTASNQFQASRAPERLSPAPAAAPGQKPSSDNWLQNAHKGHRRRRYTPITTRSPV